MPGLTDIDPQGELVRRITALEAEQRRIGTLRRRPSPLCKMVDLVPQSFPAATLTKVNLISTVQPAFDTAGMADDVNHDIVIPSRGIYQQTVFIPCFSGADQIAAAYFYVNGSAVYQDAKFQFGASETVGGRTFTAINVLDAGWRMSLVLYFLTHSTGAVSSSNRTIAFTINRLGDIPAGIAP